MTTIINGQPPVNITAGAPFVVQTASIQRGTFAAMPASAVLNSIWVAEDTWTTYMWNGSAWVPLATPSVEKASSEMPASAGFNVVPSASTSWPSGGWILNATLTGRKTRVELSAMIRQNGAAASLQIGYLELWHTAPGGSATKVKERPVEPVNDGATDGYGLQLLSYTIAAPAVGAHAFEAKVRQITGSSLDVYARPAGESGGEFIVTEIATT